MASIDDPKGTEVTGKPAPFVVSRPCPVCRGRDSTSGEPCSACHGTGVALFYHGTKAELKAGDLIEPGQRPNFGDSDRVTSWVYFTGTLDAATWGAELAQGDGLGRIYIVRPTGAFEDDPNLTDKRYPGNPTKSYRSRAPLLDAMKEDLERAREKGVQPIDD
jgi:Rifampin ADP-ribosyl transferase